MAYVKEPATDNVSFADAPYFNHMQDGIFNAAAAADLALQEIAAIEASLGTSKPPAITNPGPRTGSVGVATELLIVATGATGYSATGLPAALVMNPTTGRISGTPSTAETAHVVVTAIGPGGASTAEFVWTISAAAAPTITKPADQVVTAEVTITPVQLEATGTTSFAVTSGTLPAGVSLNTANGRISGIPTAAEAIHSVTITATGPGGTTTTSFQWTVNAALTLPMIRAGEPKVETTGTELKAPEPTTGTVIGDLLVLLVQTITNTATVTTPTGWAPIGTLGNLAARNFYAFAKAHDGTAMPTVKTSVSCEFEMRLLSIQGGESIDVNSGWNNQAATTSIAIASVTTTAANDLDIAITAHAAAGGTQSPPAGWTAFNTKNQFRVFYKSQAVAGASGATTSGNTASEAATAITFAVKKTVAVTGLTDKLSADHKSVEPVSAPGGMANIRVALCTAESGQDENTEYSTVPAGTTNIFGTVSHPWVALQALNTALEPIGPFTPRLKTTPTPSAPVVTKPAKQNGTVGQAVSLQIVATEAPTSYALTGTPSVPPGLSISSSGLITGTPTTAGTYKVKVTATNTTGTSPAVEWEWVIAAATVGLTSGLAMNSDATSTASLAAIAFGASVVRVEFGIGTAASTVKEMAETMKSHGTLLQPLAGFSGRLPTAAEAKGLKAWAEALATLSPAPQFIEFGNETSYGYQFGEGGGEWYNSATYKERAKNYALRAKEAADALIGTGIKLLVQGDDGGSGSPNWVNEIFAAWAGITSHAAFGGWTVHAYPNSKVETETDTQGVPKMERLVKNTESHGDATSKIFNTEWGTPSTNAGTTMASGQSLSWSEAAKLLEKHRLLLEKASRGRLTQLLLYQAHDQAAEGGTEREWYFGALTSSGASKGAFTTFAKSFL